ncbi:LacI family transcriptional regulator [Tetragenococcus halophilus subsp. flandriensis]|uniref:LacI family DNA-binding transcriptional regulator n=1 Tax=Tetragenococcus halophilus TaxID=51669 RepID=UPI0023E9F740|nr:LacI family DNA-binding transcriptional regulator [Tetragenococcus halophilus]GMA07620.1 LacI family transcriptional regulator [Tetragenococcus halophilus subsp. flandriensis]
MATIQEVAKLANVSVGSVSRYLNGHKLKEANMKRIEAAITELDYKQNFSAKGLKSNRTMSIGLLINNAQSTFSASMIATLADELEKLGYSMLFSGFHQNKSHLETKLEFLLSRKVDGLIVFEAEPEWKEVQRFKDLDIPVVSINTPLDLPKVDSIIMDNRQSTKKVVKKMIDYGHRKIGIIAGLQKDYIARERLKGAFDAFNEMLLPISEYAKVYYGDYSKASGYTGVNELLKQQISAIFICNYNMSLGSLQAIYEKDILLGKELSFASFDYFDSSDIFKPKLTVIRQPVVDMSLLAAKQIVKKIQQTESSEGKQFVIPNKILWRDSVRRIK